MYVKAQLLLAVSVIAAIAFVGCIYELSSGEPELGSTITWAILGVSLPACVFFFLTAVKLARASIENDR
ncbi:hypothetical protein [Pseudanabaena sp. PCC 6802]|uniref:hypothetical protein n=1 Tax=Pseudanabaena sp. PCC 6802 TaxID=118173 RepID=UPI00034A9756|nr:hypothetical protein [Pseudanabaena sp. PCC 6802]